MTSLQSAQALPLFPTLQPRPATHGLPLFDTPPHTLAGRDDPETSKAAAVALVESGEIETQREHALGLLNSHGPGTIWDLAAGDAKLHHLLARRFPELQREGLARVQRGADGQEIKRGRSRVWELSSEDFEE